MSETTKVFGKGGTVEHQGKKYPYAPLNLDMLAFFSAWLEDQAWRRVESQRGRISESAYQGRLDAVARLVGANTFDYEGQIAEAASRTPAGRRFLWYLMLANGKGEHPVDEGLAAEIYDADPAGISARMQSANADPPPGTETA